MKAPPFTLLAGDAIEQLRTLPDNSVQACITSPPYFGLRDYGCEGQIGLEQTPAAYVSKLVSVFEQVHRVLKEDGTLWLNLGDSYVNAKGRSGGADEKNPARRQRRDRPQDSAIEGLKRKDLIGIPWRVAFALQAAGWYLRQDIIWAKPNPMPAPVTDRCVTAHEYLFLLSKSPRYFFDHEAIREPAVGQSVHDLTGGKYHAPGQSEHTPRSRKNEQSHRGRAGFNERWDAEDGAHPAKRNKRSVWTVTPKPFKAAHFAVMPPDLVEPCVLAGSSTGDIVLDPFSGAGTTGVVAMAHCRRYWGIELNPEYIEITRQRFAGIQLALEAA